MSNLVVAPIVLPLVTGALLIFSRRLPVQRSVSLVAALAGVAVSVRLTNRVWTEGIQTFYAANLPAPFGITLVADLTSAAFMTATAVAALAVLLFSFYSLDRRQEEHFYYPAFQFLLVGVNGSFLTGDIFNLFVFFELMLMASYLLVGLGGRPVQLRETLKYALINNVTSGFFLLGVAGLYRAYGTLNMADLAARIQLSDSGGWLTVIAVLFLIVFGVKSAMVPLHVWLPESYTAGPTPVVAFFGGVLSKVGIYCLLRTFTLLFVEDPAFTHEGLLLPLAVVTMVAGIVGAVAKTDFKRILAYDVVSQIGYMLWGIALYTPLAIAGTVIFVLHQIIVKPVLFLCAGAAERVTGTTNLKRMGGLLTTHGSLGALFLAAAFSLVGVPPLSGFFGKVTLVRAAIDAERYATAAVALAVSLGTLYAMVKIFRLGFWGDVFGDRRLNKDSREFRGMVAAIATLVAVSLAMGLGAEAVFTYAAAAADQLLDGQAYIQAVLGGFDPAAYALAPDAAPLTAPAAPGASQGAVPGPVPPAGMPEQPEDGAAGFAPAEVAPAPGAGLDETTSDDAPGGPGSDAPDEPEGR
ncbi:MAG TPA: proton-conducting transporter membrane subunit [Limnochordales bacterium]